MKSTEIFFFEGYIYAGVAQCGFVDLPHLNKHFKSIFGITAFEYLSIVKN